MENHHVRIPVGLFETQPATVEGLKGLISSTPDLECRWAASSLMVGMQLARQHPVSLVLLDKSFGSQNIVGLLSHLSEACPGSAVVVWGSAMTEAEAVRLLKCGAAGLLRKSADIGTITACLRSVAAGNTWIEDSAFRDPVRSERAARYDLTPREQEVLSLVEQGLKNREIGERLGICAGTVKIHLKHIFEKTGVHGRFGLALDSLRLSAPGGVPRVSSASHSS
jgi:two-component system, NarL family, nitrate/nitrite response regulator NarL